MANLRGKLMVLGLKSEEESKVVNDEPVVEQSNDESDATIDVTEELNITVDPEPLVGSIPAEDTAASRAARRAERIANFQAEAIARDRAFYEHEKKIQLQLLSEDQHNRYIREQEEIARMVKLENERVLFRQRRYSIHENARLLKIQQEANGVAYQNKLDSEKEGRERAARLQLEAERNAAEAIRLAEEAQRAADIVNAEAERFADEARRRLAFAEAKAREADKKSKKLITLKNNGI